MKIAVDCRMTGKSGIGAFLDGILPYFVQSENSFLFLCLNDKSSENLVLKYSKNENVEFLRSSADIFSVKETFFFPKNLSKKINECGVYFSPYCNIPNGIKIPIFTTIHDVVFLDIPDLAGKLGTFIRKIFYKKAIFQSKEIFTVSNFSKNRIGETLNCKKNINVVYSALPEFFYKKDFQNQEKTNSIIFIGNIKKHKGLNILIPAFLNFINSLTEEQKNSVKLIIVGSKQNFRTQDDTILNLLSKIPEKNLEFTGFISDDELNQKLSTSKILVQPSLYEGFGLPPLQALFCKTNVILSDIPVFKEIYKDFPVTFFKSEDIDDLTQKIKKVWAENKKIENIPQKYSFKFTAQKILDRLTFI